MNRGVPVNRRSMRAAQTTLYAAVRDGSWDVVQVKVRVARALLVFPIRRRVSTESRPSATPVPPPTRSADDEKSGPRAHRSALTSTLADSRATMGGYRPQLTDWAQTAAVSTAVGAVVSTVLLAVAFALVLSFRWLVVPHGPSATHQELFLDFTLPNPSAVATFMPPKSVEAIERLKRASPEKPISNAALRSHRVVAPHQSYDVRLEFRLPESEHNRDVAGTFQVLCELLNGRGEVIANATRPVTLKHTSFELRLLKLLVKWPLYVLDVARETHVVSLPVFSARAEARDSPFVAIRTTLFARAGAPGGADAVPHVYSAHADIQLDMGPLRKFLYYYPASSFVIMLGVTWGYLCAAALLLFAGVAAAGLVRSPRAFAEEVVRRAAGVVKGGGTGEGRNAETLDAFPQPFFDGGGTTSEEEDEAARRASAESAAGSESSGASDLGGATTAGLRYRGAPRPDE